jgi:crotonobetainyl-CoA:carnitine CoA-transferase CaiB-like acyl-CoA transferase
VPGIGVVPLFGLTARFEKTPARITASPPRLSADTAAVLAGVGVTETELTALKAKGVV